MKKKSLLMLGLCMVLSLVLAGTVMAGAPKPACGTNGPLTIQNYSPDAYSYVQTSTGGTSGGFTVFSPAVQTTGSCDATLDPVYGNGKSGADITVGVSISGATVPGATPTDPDIPVDPSTLALIQSLFSFSPSDFTLTNPGTGSQAVSFTFTNSSALPVGEYDVTITIKPETGVGIGSTDLSFVFLVTAPTAVDTEKPTVQITSPTNNAVYVLNAPLPVSFTAYDPEEGGAGTGVTSVEASVASTGGSLTYPITPLTTSTALPVNADVTVTVTANLVAAPIGSFILTAKATDGASPVNTGEDSKSFTVKANVQPLQPISVQGKVFKVGSTVPIKWTFTDFNGAYLPPFPSIHIKIDGPAVDERGAGDGAANIRWDVDDSGNATAYITNFQIPLVGLYTVEVFVDDVDGHPMSQGSFTFTSSTKGGK